MIYPVVRRRIQRAGQYISSRTQSTHNQLHSYKDNHNTNESGTKRKKFRHPLSIPDTQWNTISDEHIALHQTKQPPPTCIAEDPADWESSSPPGITVVRETIVHSAEKDNNRGRY